MERSCKNPGFDSAGSYRFTGLGGLVLMNDVGASPAPPRNGARPDPSRR